MKLSVLIEAVVDARSRFSTGGDGQAAKVDELWKHIAAIVEKDAPLFIEQYVKQHPARPDAEDAYTAFKTATGVDDMLDELHSLDADAAENTDDSCWEEFRASWGYRQNKINPV